MAATLSARPRVYAPRRAADSPLYRVVLDHIETLLSAPPDSPGPDPGPSAEGSLRAFLECGIPRFGVARFRCRACGGDLFVPFSCKRRLACPSCDGKRSALECDRALAALLPSVPYRQWVLVVPKRLRWFLHRDARLAGELSRILARALARFYRARAGARADAAPAQLHVIQRFGSKVNLHVHVHAAVSDGVFELEHGRLRFLPTPPPSDEEVERLSREVRRRVLRRVWRLKAAPHEALAELIARPRGGFSLNGKVLVGAQDRAGLARLLGYMLRPALAVTRLDYFPERDRMRYRPKSVRPGEPAVLEWPALEFLARFARLIPPARLHLVRYHGALGPRSRLRPGVTRATRDEVPYDDLVAGGAPAAALAVTASAARALVRTGSAAAGTWAACLRRVFEAAPPLCPHCAGVLVPVAVITEDRELERLLAHLGLPVDFPKTSPARGPPRHRGEESQLDTVAEAWEGLDELPRDGDSA